MVGDARMTVEPWLRMRFLRREMRARYVLSISNRDEIGIFVRPTRC